MNREQCEGCAYFLGGSGGKECNTMKFCHYMLYTGERRKVGKKEKCLSRKGSHKKLTNPFEIPTQQM